MLLSRLNHITEQMFSPSYNLHNNVKTTSGRILLIGNL